MADQEPELVFPEPIDAGQAPGATASLARRAWGALSEWEREDLLVGLLIVPVAVAVGGILALTLLLVATLFAPVLAAWLLWLAVRARTSAGPLSPRPRGPFGARRVGTVR
jgi:hypothetical protein